MILFTTVDKIDKLPKFVKIISLTPVESDSTAVYVYDLLPTSLAIRLVNGDMSSKKFRKAYSAYLKDSPRADYPVILNVQSLIYKGYSIAFVMPKELYKKKAYKPLADYLYDKFAITAVSFKEAKAAYKEALAMLDKKQRKILNKDIEEIADDKKKLKMRKKAVKALMSELCDELDDDAKRVLEKNDKLMAIDQVALALYNDGVISYTENNEPKIVGTPSPKSPKIAADAICYVADKDKFYKKIIKSILSNPSVDLSLSPKKLKKLTPEQSVLLIATIAREFTKQRAELEV